MKKVLAIFFLVLFLTSLLSAICSENQININTASAVELQEFHGIGPAKSQAIIDTRPFSSVDDLINVYGIGDVTLANIKSQGLACVSSEQEDQDQNPEEENQDQEFPDSEQGSPDTAQDNSEDQELNNQNENTNNNENPNNNEDNTEALSITANTITLNSQNTKDIKTLANKQEQDSELVLGIQKDNFAKISLLGFCILISALLMLRKNKFRYEKNEFQK